MPGLPASFDAHIHIQPMGRTLTLLYFFTCGHFAAAQQYEIDSLCWGLSGRGTAILEDTVRDRIFVGGDFVQVRDPRRLQNCAEFDATSGLVVRQSPNPDGAVRCALPDGAGGWYIGGDFSEVGGQPRSRLAHILPDGSVSTWAPSVVGSVRAMLIKGDTIYFGGGFTQVNGAARSHLAAVRRSTGNNVAWTQGTANDTVRCLSLNSGRLYVGGDFTTVNGTARSRIASFTVSNHALTTWAPSADDRVRCAIATASAVYIGGDFTTINGIPRGGGASLNPTGNFVLTWNPNTNGSVNCMFLSGASVLLGGTFTQVMGSPRNRIASVASGSSATLSTWSRDLDGAVEGMTVVNDVVYATGSFERVDAVFRHRLVALGLPGTVAPAILDWRASVYGDDVWCVAAQGSGVFVGGAFHACGLSRRSIAAYDQATGLPLAWDPGVNGEVRSLAQGADGTLYAAGSFTSAGGVTRANMVALDPLTGAVLPWTGGATLGDVNDIVVSGDTLVACGTFAFLGGTPRLGLGALSRTTGTVLPWNLPVAPGDEPKTLLLHRDTLFIGGVLTAIGGQARNAVASIRLSTGAVLPFTANCTAGSSVDHMVLDEGLLWVGNVDGIWGGQHINTWDLLVLDASTGVIQPRQPMTGTTLAVRGNKIFTGPALKAHDKATGWLAGSVLLESCDGALVVAQNGDLLGAGIAEIDDDDRGFFRVRIDPSPSIRVMLDGPFSTGTMTPDLQSQGLLPPVEPYTSLGYPHTGGGGGESATWLPSSPSSDVIDWIVVEYRDAQDPSIVVASASRLLYSTGRVERANGFSLPTFTADPNGSYYVAVRHRNHLGVMTAQPVDFSTSPFIDFTLPTTAVYGTAARKTNSGGVMCLWAGDVNFDGTVKYTGAANDRDPILVSVGGVSPNSILNGVYHAGDVNMDGQVKYTGSKNDRDRVLLSIGGTTPSSTRADQLP